MNRVTDPSEILNARQHGLFLQREGEIQEKLVKNRGFKHHESFTFEDHCWVTYNKESDEGWRYIYVEHLTMHNGFTHYTVRTFKHGSDYYQNLDDVVKFIDEVISFTNENNQ